MIKKLQHIFALSEKGAKDLVKAVIWCFVCNLALMFPVGAVLFTVQHLLGCLEGGGSSTDGFWLYVGFALAVLLLLFVLHWFQYASLYIATYRESANRRVSLAETLRRLPLSFFGNRDLSDLTATMIADCSSLDQMFSHFVPQLFASVGSTLVIGVCMFACDWRMALAVLWVVPVAVALTAGSKKIQDAFGTKNILNKRAVADCIQEGLETIRDIKACHRQERYLGDLEAKLSAMEGSSIRSELATGVFVCSAQAFLRLGLATTVLTGGALLLAGELSFLYFLGFLFAAARLYDPLGVVLQNIAATFNTKLQIERMRSILEQPVQTGTENFHPDRYDITFDHVSFAYREGAGVLENVSFTARQGEVTALIGPSGGGKSTACKLAARFWDVTGGKVLLGGTDVSTVDPENLLRSYSMVFQDVVLFRDTVMENIRLGRRGATDEEVLEAAKAALDASDEGGTVGVPLTLTEPSITTAKLEDNLFKDVLGTGTTSCAGPSNRWFNIDLAADRVNDTILLPGETFSYNDTAGPYTLASGYKAAGTYQNGQSVDATAGGICQLSSTLYWVTLKANLETVERHKHQFNGGYMPVIGTDATVWSNQLDFRFKNNTEYPIKIEAYLDSSLAMYETALSGETVSEEAQALAQAQEAQIAAMFDAWKNRDPEAFLAVYDKQAILNSDDELNAKLFTERDPGMIAAAAEYLETEGENTFFLAVGAGHMVDPGGIVSGLRELGYTVELVP